MAAPKKKTSSKELRPDRTLDDLLEESARLRLKADEVRQRLKELAKAIRASAAGPLK